MKHSIYEQRTEAVNSLTGESCADRVSEVRGGSPGKACKSWGKEAKELFIFLRECTKWLTLAAFGSQVPVMFAIARLQQKNPRLGQRAWERKGKAAGVAVTPPGSVPSICSSHGCQRLQSHRQVTTL